MSANKPRAPAPVHQTNRHKIQLRRVYDEPSESDGVRILVERLWPRGLSKDKARIDFWSKETAPSPELRRWFDHDPNKWIDFQRRYQAELETNQSAVEELVEQMGGGPVTFVFAAKDTEHNNAVALRNYIGERQST